MGRRPQHRPEVRASPRLPLYSLAMASATALAYEILLTRLFAIIHWHHFAYMIISLALLGYGLSGTVLALVGEPLLRRYDRSYPFCLGLFALTLPACFLLAQSVNLHPEAMLWQPALYWRLPLVYLVLAVPFFFIALAVAILLTRFWGGAGKVYAADLAGAGGGSVALLGLLMWLLPQDALWVLAVAAAVATLVSLVELRQLMQPAAGLVVLALVSPVLVPADATRLDISPFKSLERTLQVSGAELLDTRSSPLGLVNVVGNPLIPFRYAPGLSLTSQAEIPAQLAVFTDAESLTVINAWSRIPSESAWLDDSTSALPYHLLRPRNILVANAGGGTEVLRALSLSAAGEPEAQLHVLEPNAQLLQLMLEDYADFSGELYRQPGVYTHPLELRDFLARDTRAFDLIVLPTPGGPGGISGLYALGENYLFTVEAFAEYLRHIDRQGYVAVTSWIQLPPRDALKILATAIAALRNQGLNDPSQRLLLIRGWQTVTLVIKGSPVTQADVSALRAFCRARGFDVVFYPGMKVAEANLVNRLPGAVFHEAATALMHDRDREFIDRYEFNIAPATDDRPYFFQFFRWRTLPDILRQRDSGGMGMLEAGYVILVVALVQAFLITLLLVLLPLAFIDRGAWSSSRPWRARLVSYFSLIGLAFMFLEIAFIQKFLLFLQHPVYSVTTVLATILVFSGLGSGCTPWLVRKSGSRALVLVVTGIAVIGLTYIALLPQLHSLLATLPLMLRMLAAVVLLAPLAFLMGVPLPLGIMRLGSTEARTVPWAWAINGCASVTGVILATLIAMHLGFSMLVLLALGLYLLCANVAPRGTPHKPAAIVGNQAGSR